MAETAHPHLFAAVLAQVVDVCRALERDGVLPSGIATSRIVVEPPKDAAHGDMATNAAMVLAKDARMKPRDLAEKIAAGLSDAPGVASVEIAGPGFINLSLAPSAWTGELRTLVAKGSDYGRSAVGAGVQVPARQGELVADASGFDGAGAEDGERTQRLWHAGIGYFDGVFRDVPDQHPQLRCCRRRGNAATDR